MSPGCSASSSSMVVGSGPRSTGAGGFLGGSLWLGQLLGGASRCRCLGLRRGRSSAAPPRPVRAPRQVPALPRRVLGRSAARPRLGSARGFSASAAEEPRRRLARPGPRGASAGAARARGSLPLRQRPSHRTPAQPPLRLRQVRLPWLRPRGRRSLSPPRARRSRSRWSSALLRSTLWSPWWISSHLSSMREARAASRASSERRCVFRVQIGLDDSSVTGPAWSAYSR